MIPKDSSKEDIQRVKSLLSSFSCELDPDIESFLHNRAIDFEHINKTRTYLLCDNNILRTKGSFVILGYFAVALKVLDLSNNISNRTRKILDGLSAKLHGNVISSIPCYLIGQLAKNSALPKELSVNGSEIIKQALSIIQSAEVLVGGRYILIECHDEPKLIKFYENNKFKALDRMAFDNSAMVQMLRPLCSTTL